MAARVSKITMEKLKKIVPDTSVIIDGRISEIIKNNPEVEVIIPEAAVSEIEFQANSGKEVGLEGLKELKNLHEKLKDKLKFAGEKPGREDIKFSHTGRIDEIIAKTAMDNDATLVTSDRIQANIAEVRGINVHYFKPKTSIKEPGIFKLFDDTTMSVHIKENTKILAKKGSVGNFNLVEISGVPAKQEIENYAKEIVAYTRATTDGFIEIQRKGATIIQLGLYRIVIARPPFSDGIEITAVRPLVKTQLSDYKLSQKLMNRLDERAEGIFVSGPPGAGKSTFACAIAEYYQKKGKIVKTMEQPRDLQVMDEITQYTLLEGSMENTSDVLLMVRPDYTVYDEVRKTQDFKIFADMRLSGVGMVGVTHASRAIDSIQRLIGRVELGIIPHIVDTVIFIRKGNIEKIYDLKMTVKVPHGMKEQDLARPVVEVRDFETGKAEYELYCYGEEIVVIPVEDEKTFAHAANFKTTDIAVRQSKGYITLKPKKFKKQFAKIFAGDRYITTAKLTEGGNIKLHRKSYEGDMIMDALRRGKSISLK